MRRRRSNLLHPLVLLLSALGAVSAFADPELSTDEIDFGEVPVGEARQEFFQLENDSDQELKWKTIGAFRRLPFSLGETRQDQRRVVPANGIDDRAVSFTPTAIGTYSWTSAFEVAYKDPDGIDPSDPLVAGQQLPITFRGTAVGPGIEVTTAPAQDLPVYDFGDVVVGSTTSMQVTLTNRTEEAVTIDLVRIKRAGKDQGFSIDARDGRIEGAGLAPGESLTFTVEFAPTEAKSTRARIVIRSEAFPGEMGKRKRFDFFLEGNGVEKLGLSTDELDFGKVETGDSQQASFTLLNRTAEPIPVKFRSKKVDKGYKLTVLTKTTLDPFEEREFTLDFDPRGKGKAVGKIEIISKDGFSEKKQTIKLKAKGVKPAPLPPGEPVVLEVEGVPVEVGSVTGVWLDFGDEIRMIFRALSPSSSDLLDVDVGFTKDPKVGRVYEIPDPDGEVIRSIFYVEPGEARFDVADGEGWVVFDRIEDDGDLRRAVGRFGGTAVNRFGVSREIEGAFDLELPYEVR